ncbi:hypothetical protein KR009_010901 [Drosophila setifemur]|nr:hypothetical protein KR009_010901 [Drosophila setifemur]
MNLPIPEAEYWDVTKQSQKEREIIRKFIPNGVNLSIINPAELYNSDTFYLECQKYRDFYRDPYGKVQKPKSFSLHKGMCGIKLDQTLALMTMAIAANEDHQPFIFPLLPYKGMGLGKGPVMPAQNSIISSTIYKR